MVKVRVGVGSIFEKHDKVGVRVTVRCSCLARSSNTTREPIDHVSHLFMIQARARALLSVPGQDISQAGSLWKLRLGLWLYKV